MATFKYEYPNGSVYEGEYCTDEGTGEKLFHGVGKLTFHNSDVYQGDFRWDEMHGIGVYCFNSGDKYSGAFEHDNFQGIGKYQYKDGTVFKGKFRNDMRIGKFVIKDETKLYQTIIQDDVEIPNSQQEISEKELSDGKFRKLAIMSKDDLNF